MTAVSPVRLRGHHLLCMLTWVGVGYTKAFSDKYDESVAAIQAGAEIEVVSGPDDLCQTLDPLTYTDYHCLDDNHASMDVQALESINDILGLNLTIGSRFTVSAELIATMRAQYKSGAIRPACQSCKWRDFCTDIARSDFAETRL